MATAKKTAATRTRVTRAPARKVAKPAAAPGKAAAKAKKPKLVRHSYTLTKAEYDVLQSLKDRTARLGQPAKKGALVRAGIALVASLPDAGLLSALAGVPSPKALRAR